MSFIRFAIWLAFLIFLSSPLGEDTVRLSLRLEWLLRVLHLQGSRLMVLHTGLLTAAHFMCSYGLGTLLHTAMCITLQKLGDIYFRAAGICGAIGILDEVKKVFICGRHLGWEEAGLNVIGAWCGIIAAIVVMGLISAGSKAGVHDKIIKVKRRRLVCSIFGRFRRGRRMSCPREKQKA